jgi:hypothetical protein
MIRFFCGVLISSVLWAASPFFDSSIYVISQVANIRSQTQPTASVMLTVKRDQAFKQLSKLSVNGKTWYKVEFYDPNQYEVVLKKRTNDSVTGRNFQTILDLFDLNNTQKVKARIMPTKRNIKYDNKKAKSQNWVRMRLYQTNVGYIYGANVRESNRPYFLVETALDVIRKYPKWSWTVKNNILKGEISLNMSPTMVKGVKGDPDYIDKDRSGKNRYYTWWYGSQAVNFRANRVTSW